MKLIEPCCAKRSMKELRDALGDDGTREIEGYGDLSLAELLPAILTRYAETTMLIAAPTIPDQAAETLQRWMNRQWERADGRGKMDVISRLTIVADLRRRKSPAVSAWLKENPFGDRLVLIDKPQTDTALLLPDFAITGPLNLAYGEHFTATATTNKERIGELWARYSDDELDAGSVVDAEGDAGLGAVAIDGA